LAVTITNATFAVLEEHGWHFRNNGWRASSYGCRVSWDARRERLP